MKNCLINKVLRNLNYLIGISGKPSSLFFRKTKSMKSAVFCIMFTLLLLSCRLASAVDKPPFKLKIAPPGTVWLRDSVFIDVNPIKNIDYREFLSFVAVTYSKEVRDTLKKIPSFGIHMENFRTYMRLAGKDPDLIKKMAIRYDMMLSWRMNMEEYINNPIYKDYPIVNISYNQAIMFCEWRTDMVMLFYATDCKKESQRLKYYTRIRYRLPTAEEFAYALSKFKNNIILNKALYAGDKVCTYPAVPQKQKVDFYYIPNNIAEMTLVDKLAVGISWHDEDTTRNYAKTLEYFGPRDWLGFRCVCEIVEY